MNNLNIFNFIRYWVILLDTGIKNYLFSIPYNSIKYWFKTYQFHPAYFCVHLIYNNYLSDNLSIYARMDIYNFTL